ncbi:hypothetical protein NLI96_g11210 [Meripilus lineatus]|uniref:Uncharacterized protein n=1 Tax=Meripilus lineatus TaxID=2056292 RepID=A0AAD5US57_9APHY|nr:hypothetical protein NLI96_g11210 [Physisporinus lineatus]
MWVFGWPLPYERAAEYVKEHKIFQNRPNLSEDQILNAACDDFSYYCNIDDVLACWVGNEHCIVVGLCVDKKARTMDQAKIDKRQLPELKYIKRLQMLMKTKEMPAWYRYADGTWFPSDEQPNPQTGEPAETFPARKNKVKTKTPTRKRVTLMPLIKRRKGKNEDVWVEC